jgi:hypothetical protein
LEQLISPLVDTLRSFILDASDIDNPSKSNDPVKLANRLGPLSRVLYQLCKARGYKTILKFFSHDVSDLEPLLEFTEGLLASKTLGKTRLVYWETMYILLLWLSLVCMIPFDLKTLDTKGDHGHETVRILLLDMTCNFNMLLNRL